MLSHTSAVIGPFSVCFRAHGVQLPTDYNKKFRAWAAATPNISGPQVCDRDTFADAMTAARDLFIANHVVWC